MSDILKLAKRFEAMVCIAEVENRTARAAIIRGIIKEKAYSPGTLWGTRSWRDDEIWQKSGVMREIFERLTSKKGSVSLGVKSDQKGNITIYGTPSAVATAVNGKLGPLMTTEVQKKSAKKGLEQPPEGTDTGTWITFSYG